MKEEFLRYIWMHHLRLQVKYKTVDGDAFVVLDKGLLNTDAGPDILQVRIKKGEVKWAGNVEFHVKASEWEKHGHHTDFAYRNVLLHVVAEADKEVYTSEGRVLPTFIFPKLHEYYETFQNTFSAKQFVYCEKEIFRVPVFIKNIWLQRLVVERLEEKTLAVFHLFEQNNSAWEETSYQLFVRYLGQRLNGDAFEQLARKLPQRILSKHKNSVFQLEALLFGQAGMLEEKKDDAYYTKLQEEYAFLQTKYNLEPMKKAVWRFLRLRPANFPTLRIAQLATLTHHAHGFFSQLLEKETLEEYRLLFSYGASVYWESHYAFNKNAPRKSKRKIGKTLQDILIVNGVVPLFFAYSSYLGEPIWQNKALRLLQEIEAEQNHITRGFEKMEMRADKAYDSQALIQLKQKYCNFKRCESCVIGHEILKQRYG